MPYSHLTNAVVSGNLTEHEESMIAQRVDVRDGDDAITFNSEEETENKLSVEEPDVDRIEIDTETGEVEGESEAEGESEEEETEGDLDFSDKDATSMESIGADMQTAMTEQEALLNEAVEKGLDKGLLAVMQDEYANGALSDSTYEALAAIGYSKTFVDSYIRSQEVVATKFAESVREYAGGEQQFSKVSEHIAANPAMTQAFNSAIDRNDAATIKALIDAAKGTLRQTFGVKPARDITKAAKPAVATAVKAKVQPFESRNEMIKAMSDKRYTHDAKYRAEVERRVAISF